MISEHDINDWGSGLQQSCDSKTQLSELLRRYRNGGLFPSYAELAAIADRERNNDQ